MIQQTIDELRKLKDRMSICFESEMEQRTKDIYTLNKAIIACEQLRKYRKKAKRWKRKYLRMVEICKEIKSDPSKECNYCEHLCDGINDFFCDECYHNFTYKNNFKPKVKGGAG